VEQRAAQRGAIVRQKIKVTASRARQPIGAFPSIKRRYELPTHASRAAAILRLVFAVEQRVINLRPELLGDIADAVL
jgi:hypothetical protein